MHIIGLTGGIASGKSTVAKMLSQLGVPIIDADTLAREVVMPGEPAYQAIISRFGDHILNVDGTINRTLLGSIIFADSNLRHELEKITHPAIRQRVLNKLSELEKSGATIVVYMAPLLIESGATSIVDDIWVVYVDEEMQILRLMERDGINRAQAFERINSQMPIEEKKLSGTVIIDNRGTLSETERQVMSAWEGVSGR
jgi:dephospho-CoA kinase